LPLNYSCAAVVGGIFNIDVFYFRCMLQVWEVKMTGSGYDFDIFYFRHMQLGW
jgi:hypothetical protein